jgi:hypothetical protein
MTWIRRTSPDDTPPHARPRAVAYIARPTQRTLNLQTHRDGVPPRRLKWLRIWGAVLNDNPAYQARGFWYDDDPHQHITWKELRVQRLAIESFFTTATRTQRLTLRGQHRRRDAVHIDYSFPRHDD